MYMQHSGSGLYEFAVACKPIRAEHSCMNDTVVKTECINYIL